MLLANHRWLAGGRSATGGVDRSRTRSGDVDRRRGNGSYGRRSQIGTVGNKRCRTGHGDRAGTDGWRDHGGNRCWGSGGDNWWGNVCGDGTNVGQIGALGRNSMGGLENRRRWSDGLQGSTERGRCGVDGGDCRGRDCLGAGRHWCAGLDTGVKALRQFIWEEGGCPDLITGAGAGSGCCRGRVDAMSRWSRGKCTGEVCGSGAGNGVCRRWEIWRGCLGALIGQGRLS